MIRNEKLDVIIKLKCGMYCGSECGFFSNLFVWCLVNEEGKLVRLLWSIFYGVDVILELYKVLMKLRWGLLLCVVLYIVLLKDI